MTRKTRTALNLSAVVIESGTVSTHTVFDLFHIRYSYVL